MSEVFDEFTWMNDYCFDCGVACKDSDTTHDGHTRLSTIYPEMNEEILGEWIMLDEEE